MPEPPDFKDIAARIEAGQPGTSTTFADGARLRTEIAEQLRQVWNARGAADIAKLGEHSAGNGVAIIAERLRTLDR